MVTSNKKIQNVPGINYTEAKIKYTDAMIILFLHLSKTEINREERLHICPFFKKVLPGSPRTHPFSPQLSYVTVLALSSLFFTRPSPVFTSASGCFLFHHVGKEEIIFPTTHLGSLAGAP